MIFFAHALHFLDEPYFAAGTGVPDWLTVVDRRVRVRRKHARPLVDDPDPRAASVAGGILQHIRDDARFHQGRVFVELSLELSAGVRDVLGSESGFRPAFLGHLLVEVLLDASLAAGDPGRLQAYYRTLDSVDTVLVQEAVNRMGSRPTERLAAMISGFRQDQILWDYLEDAKLLVRLNQVLHRVKFAQLPDAFADFLPGARRLVDGRKS